MSAGCWVYLGLPQLGTEGLSPVKLNILVDVLLDVQGVTS